MNWLKMILVGAILPPSFGAVYYFYVSHQSEVNYNKAILAVFIVFAYWFALLIGVPAVIALKKKGIVTLKIHLLFGCVTAISAFVFLCLFSSVLLPMSELAVFGVLGFFGGFCSWYIVKE